jgi:membrane protease YdiL (CAAX protease family)
VIASELSHQTPPYAGLPRRVVAGLVDLAIAWAAYSIAITALDPHVASEYATTQQTVVAAVILVSIVALWFGYLVFAQSRWGQTLGMRALGIRVVGEPGQTLSWSRALVRSLLLVVDWVVGPFLILLSRRRQRLGDRLANTVVLMKGEDRYAAGTGGAVDTGAPLTAPPSGPGGSVPPPGAGTQAPPRNVAATWGPGRVGVGILVLLVLSVVEVGIVSAFDSSLDSLGARLAAQAMLAATLIGVAFAVAADRGFPGTAAVPRWTLGLRRSLHPSFVIAASAGLAYVVAAIVYSGLVNPHQEDITRDLGFGHGDLGTVAAGILIVGAAPLSEEIFFRGFIFGGFRRRLSFPIAAIISAAIFGLFHYTGSGSLTVVPQLAFLGFALCWVYERTGSIYPTIALHMLNNAVAFVVLTS